MPLSEALMDRYLSQPLFVTAELPVMQFGYRIGEMTVHVRPAYDEAMGNPYRACEVFVEDDSGKRHGLSDSDAAIVLGRIHDELPATWREIVSEAEAN